MDLSFIPKENIGRESDIGKGWSVVVGVFYGGLETFYERSEQPPEALLLGA